MSNADLIRALRACQQYDADGVMCVVSLQACVEAAEALEAQEWRTDMENAPRDGDEILVGAHLPWHGWRADLVQWEEVKNNWWISGGMSAPPYEPTHWKPLDTPPDTQNT